MNNANVSQRPESLVTVAHIQHALKRMGDWGHVYVPEFTWGNLRIDAAVINVRKRWVRGFEIKMNLADWRRDEKWQFYTEFCSSLSIVCPKGLIPRDEVKDPFGLVYVSLDQFGDTQWKWVKKPKRFQKRDGLAWIWTYLRVIERELPRLVFELERAERDLRHVRRGGGDGAL
jgi:hypothetical protein